MTTALKRNLIFLLTLLSSGLSVAFMTMPDVGTGPINTLPYELSMYTSCTIGQATFAMYLLFLLLQYVLTPASRRNSWSFLYYLGAQLPAGLVFAVAIDASMFLLRCLFGYEFDNYLCRLLMMAGGILLLVASIAVQLIVQVTMLPGDGFVKVTAERLGWEFGRLKLWFDIAIVALAALYGLWASGCTAIISVREGTLLAVLTLGPLISYVRPRMTAVERWIYGGEA